MFWNKKGEKVNFDNPSTIIGRGLYLEAAAMSGAESVRIEGTYKGLIDINGPLVLGEEGSISGDVQAQNCIIAGEVNGNIDSMGALHFTKSAKVTGDINASSLVVEAGSQVIGRYSIGKRQDVNKIEASNYVEMNDE